MMTTLGLFADSVISDTAESETPETPYPVRDGFNPQTAEEIEWVIDRVNSARERAKRVKEQAAKMVKEASDEAAFFETYYAPQLEAFAKRTLAGGKVKSVKLLTGTVGFRTVAADIKQVDATEETAMAWAKANLPSAVVVRETLSWATLKDALAVAGDGKTVVFKETGEAIDGFVRVEPEQERLYVK